MPILTSNQLHFDSELHKQMRTKKIKVMFPEKGKKIIEHYTKATQKVMHTSARQESTIKTLCSDLLSEMCDLIVGAGWYIDALST